MQEIQQPFHTDHCHGNALSDGSMRHQAGGARSQYSRLAWPFFQQHLDFFLASFLLRLAEFLLGSGLVCSAHLHGQNSRPCQCERDGYMENLKIPSMLQPLHFLSALSGSSPPTLSHLVSFLLLISSFLYTALPPLHPTTVTHLPALHAHHILLTLFDFLILMHSTLESEGWQEP